ncbi:hypothetical protein VitviT2T_001604 [Vitis vinifera]|uniref:Uncharacterized protein n=1 Tax=Vitis vinifera TaxID=29760 RepID=A0ABY9BGF9_VITVI|nr:hypothetical protein VitviT2T_001604 [Vitis vinifera]
MYTSSGMPIYDVDVVLGCKEQLLHQKTAVASSSDAHFCFGNSAAIGGVELTRLLMTCMKASGQEHFGHGSQTPQSVIQRRDNGPEASQLAASEQIASGTPKYCY